jgi:hypothetical protein
MFYLHLLIVYIDNQEVHILILFKFITKARYSL